MRNDMWINESLLPWFNESKYQNEKIAVVVVGFHHIPGLLESFDADGKTITPYSCELKENFQDIQQRAEAQAKKGIQNVKRFIEKNDLRLPVCSD
eukprot:gene111-642_t